MTQILLLLQLAVSLLTLSQANPSSTQEQRKQALDFANKAISTAIDYVNQNPIQVPQTQYQPIQPAPVSMGAPIIDNVVSTPVEAPSCKLIGKISSYISPENPLQRIEYSERVSFDWVLTGMPTSTEGTIYLQDGHFGEINGNQKGLSASYRNPTKLNERNRNKDEFGVDQIYKAQFGNATCYAFFPAWIGNVSPQPGDYSTSNPIPPFDGMNL